jgi:hypothetical protein
MSAHTTLEASKGPSDQDQGFFGHPRGKEKTTIGACEEPAENYPQPVWQSLSETIRSANR